MNSGRGQDIRFSPADGAALLHQSYDLRARDGKVIATVSRERAQRGIAAGALELWKGPAGAYLRSALLSRPAEARSTSVQPDSRNVLPGALPKGVIPPVIYSRRHATCGQMGHHRVRRVGPRYGVPV
jgi:hypothetical protein